MAGIRHDYDPRDGMDAVILKSLEEKLENQLARAFSEIEYVHEELRRLAAERSLADAYREAYVRLLAVASPAFRAIHESHLAMRQKPRECWQFGRPDPGLPPESWIRRCRQIIAEINATDLQLGRCLSDMRNRPDRQPDALFDWYGTPRLDVVLTLDAGPSRPFYDHLDCQYVGDDRYRLQVDAWYSHPTTDEGAENWNEFDDPEHPLSRQRCHMGYLCHCILFHLCLPWQLLPCIHEIEAILKFSDYQTLWPVAKRAAHGQEPQPGDG